MISACEDEQLTTHKLIIQALDNTRALRWKEVLSSTSIKQFEKDSCDENFIKIEGDDSMNNDILEVKVKPSIDQNMSNLETRSHYSCCLCNRQFINTEHIKGLKWKKTKWREEKICKSHVRSLVILRLKKPRGIYNSK